MVESIQIYNDIIPKVCFFYKALSLNKLESNKGRKLALSIPKIIALAIFKQKMGITTKKAIYEIFNPNCSYKTLVVNLNRFSSIAAKILLFILQKNCKKQHLIKHTDSTDVPVCSNRKVKKHKTMQGLASWSYNGKGYFFGLKLHITTDLKQNVLNLCFTPGNVADKNVFMKLNDKLKGIFIADCAYVSKKLAKEFNLDYQRILFAKPRKNMKVLTTKIQNMLYDTRMRIEMNFRNLKCFYNLITSLPRSINGYFANYIYSLLAYLII